MKFYFQNQRIDQSESAACRRGDNFSPRMQCQWYVRGGGDWGGQAADSDWSVRCPPPLLEWHSDVLICHLSPTPSHIPLAWHSGSEVVT
jgi:hypothetical protein